MNILLRSLCILTLLGVTFPMVTTPVQAQERRLISGAQCTSATECTLFLPLDRLGRTLAGATILLREDNSELAIQAPEVVETGIQLVWSLDENVTPDPRDYDVRSPGLTGAARYQECAGAERVFYNYLQSREPPVLSERDWLAALRTGDTEEHFPFLVTWQNNNHGAFDNTLYRHEPEAEKNTPKTPLYKLLKASLESFRESGAPAHLLKSVVVCTDGYDAEKSINLDDVISQARNQNVQVHVLMHGAHAQRERNLRRITDLTGGQFVQLKTMDEVAAIAMAVEQERSQVAVTFQPTKPNPKQLSVTVTLADGQTWMDTIDFPPFNPQPPLVTIPADENGILTVERIATRHDQPLQEIEPLVERIGFDVAWSDGLAHTPAGYECWLNGQLIPQTHAVSDQRCDLPIAEMNESQAGVGGRNTFVAAVWDEFGRKGESAPISLALIVKRPSAPQLTLPPTTDGVIVIERQADSHDQLLSAITPASELVSFEVARGDGEAYGVVARECLLDGQVVAQADDVPLNTCALPLDLLAEESASRLQISISDEQGQTATAEAPVQLRILRPPAPQVAVMNVELVEGNPRMLNVQLKFTDVDPATLSAVLYTMTDALGARRTYTQTTEPFSHFVLPIGELAGDYTLTAQAYAGEALIASAVPLTLDIPLAAAGRLLWPWLLLLIPLLALTIILGVRQRNRKRQQQSELVSFGNPMPDSTQPEQLPDWTAPEDDIFPCATMVLKEGGPDAPERIPLHSQRLNGQTKDEWKIGRSYESSEYVIADRRISKLHATIIAKDGQFFIRDEGSSGGTYLNKNPRRLTPQVLVPLDPSDLINFNAVAYYFTVDDSLVTTPLHARVERLGAGTSSVSASSSTILNNSSDATEPETNP